MYCNQQFFQQGEIRCIQELKPVEPFNLQCRREETRVCGPSSCPLAPGKRICENVAKAVSSDETYRVRYRVVHLGCIDFDFRLLATCYAQAESDRQMEHPKPTQPRCKTRCPTCRRGNSGNLEALLQVLEDVPNEICDLVPQRVCNQVTKLVPKLVPKRKCVDEPNEICVR